MKPQREGHTLSRSKASTHHAASSAEPEQATEDLLFTVARAGLDVEVHQRVGVRVLELSDKKSGSRIELEGYRNPLTYSKRVIDALRS